MNIIQQAWLPFRLRDGSEKVLPIAKICDPNVVDFALPRADFQGAAYQFAIGLLQTTFAPQDEDEWAERYQDAPAEEELQIAFDRVAHAFNTLGDGPLFMQDFEVLDGQKPTTVAGLLIEAPGFTKQTQDKNIDHFIKRDVCEVMSLEMAVLALFTLQINAPEGGSGHRAGLRGGGPLTTLVLPPAETVSLWQKLWLNVMQREQWDYDDPDFTDGSVFPWLAPTRESSKKGSEIYHTDVHPLHMYWAMPRRIRLLVAQVPANCQISGVMAPLTVTNYITKNYGGNYSGTWNHPLTPYKWDPKKPEQEHLSIKGQSGGINYKIWGVMTLSSDKDGQHCARVADHYQSIATEVDLGEQPRLWVFGFDLAQAKARGWYSVTMPLFHVEIDEHDAIIGEIKRFEELADNAIEKTGSIIFAALFGVNMDDKGKKKLEKKLKRIPTFQDIASEKKKKVKIQMSFIDLAFWQRSESAFFTVVENIIRQTKGDSHISPQQAGEWLNKLRGVCSDLFDEYALSELGNQRSMAKRIKARQELMGWLYGGRDGGRDMKNFIEDYKIASIKDIA